MKTKYITTLFLCISVSLLAAKKEDQWNIAHIPDSLLENAHAVVRESASTFEYKSLQSGKFTSFKAITILNDKGKDYANFFYSGDKNQTLISFSGKVCDATGNILFKIKNSDISTSEYSSYLASDDINYYYNCTPPTYPCTIIYEYEVNFKNGVLTFPPFMPQLGSKLSIQKASHTIQTPPNTPVMNKNLHVSAPTITPSKNGNNCYNWSIKNRKAYEEEILSPSAFSFLPIAFSRPQHFIYDRIQGEITDWNSMGRWVYSLLKDRQSLPEVAKEKIRSLTVNATCDRDKVKILYDYLGKTTRYEAILLGIGGYQPMPAEEVFRVNFGDCKALTNYLSAMLQTIGIISNYTIIKMEHHEKDVLADYANFHQFNHVILQVPLKEDTIWLECTNPEVPFGFIHNSIAGHQALVINENGGQLVRLPNYSDTLSTDLYISEITLTNKGEASAKTINHNHVKAYDYMQPLVKAKYTEQVDQTRKNINLPNATITQLRISEDKSPLPCLTLNFEWQTPLYGTKTGNRLFIPINTLRSGKKLTSKKQRLFDIEISDGYVNEDSITLVLPKGHVIESLPAPIEHTSPFGSFCSTLNLVENKIVIHQKLVIRRGLWPAAQYPELISLFDKASSGYRGKIILKAQ